MRNKVFKNIILDLNNQSPKDSDDRLQTLSTFQAQQMLFGLYNFLISMIIAEPQAAQRREAELFCQDLCAY